MKNFLEYKPLWFSVAFLLLSLIAWIPSLPVGIQSTITTVTTAGQGFVLGWATYEWIIKK